MVNKQQYCKLIFERERMYVLMYVQGISFGFDIMYLALAERNMQVRFGLKVVWEF